MKKLCTTTLSGPSSVWLMNLGKTRKEVVDRLLDVILSSLFGPVAKEIISKETFYTNIKNIENRGLYAAGQQICDEIMALVRKRRNVQDTIRKIFSQDSKKLAFPAEKEAELNAHLNDIFPLNLFTETAPLDLQNIDRQLQGLLVRLERFHANPGKDNQKSAQLSPYLENLYQLMEKREELSGEALERVLRFRDLVNEYRISLFSPEIKTREPSFTQKTRSTMEINTGQVLRVLMNKVTLGVLLCLSSLILLNGSHAVIGIIMFIVGIIFMYGWERPRK